MPLALGVGAAAGHLAGSVRQGLGRRWAAVVLLVVGTVRMKRVLIIRFKSSICTGLHHPCVSKPVMNHWGCYSKKQCAATVLEGVPSTFHHRAMEKSGVRLTASFGCSVFQLLKAPHGFCGACVPLWNSMSPHVLPKNTSWERPQEAARTHPTPTG